MLIAVQIFLHITGIASNCMKSHMLIINQPVCELDSQDLAMRHAQKARTRFKHVQHSLNQYSVGWPIHFPIRSFYTKLLTLTYRLCRAMNIVSNARSQPQSSSPRSLKASLRYQDSALFPQNTLKWRKMHQVSGASMSGLHPRMP
jgi:hypothetical protein